MGEDFTGDVISRSTFFFLFILRSISILISRTNQIVNFVFNFRSAFLNSEKFVGLCQVALLNLMIYGNSMILIFHDASWTVIRDDFAKKKNVRSRG